MAPEGKKKKNFVPEVLSPGKWLFPYPIYTVKSSHVQAVNGHLILVGGGGGKSKTGVPNVFNLMKLENKGVLDSSVVFQQDTEDRIIYAADFHPSLPLIAVAEGNFCYIYKILTKDSKVEGVQLIQHFQTDFEGEDSVQSICEFSPDGKFLATAGEEGVIRLWKIASQIPTKGDIASKIQEIKFQESINSLGFSKNSKMMVYTSKTNCEVWEIENKKKLIEVTPVDIKAPGSKPTFRGCTFLGESSSEFFTPQGKPRFKSLVTEWKTDSGKLVKKLTPSLNGPPTALGSAYGEKQQVIAVSYGEGDIEVYSVSEKGTIGKYSKLKGVHSFIVTAVAITSDQKCIVSGSVDRTLSITPLKKGGFPIILWVSLVFLLIILLFLFTFTFVTGIQPAIQMLPTI